MVCKKGIKSCNELKNCVLNCFEIKMEYLEKFLDGFEYVTPHIQQEFKVMNESDKKLIEVKRSAAGNFTVVKNWDKKIFFISAFF